MQGKANNGNGKADERSMRIEKRLAGLAGQLRLERKVVKENAWHSHLPRTSLNCAFNLLCFYFFFFVREDLNTCASLNSGILAVL